VLLAPAANAMPPEHKQAVLGRADGAGAAPSSLFTSTITAPCAGRTVACVIAVWTHQRRGSRKENSASLPTRS
jgi:hypothetical protein